MSEKGNIWLNLPRSSTNYISGVNTFLKNAMINYAVENELKCACSRCDNHEWWGQDDVYDHLIYNGPSLTVARWIYDVSNLMNSTDMMDFEANTGFEDNLDRMLNITYNSRGPNEDARKFYRLVEDGKQPLYPGCKKFSRLSF